MNIEKQRISLNSGGIWLQAEETNGQQFKQIESETWKDSWD